MAKGKRNDTQKGVRGMFKSNFMKLTYVLSL